MEIEKIGVDGRTRLKTITKDTYQRFVGNSVDFKKILKKFSVPNFKLLA